MNRIFSVVLSLVVFISGTNLHASALNLNGKQAILVDLTTNTVLYEKDADTPVPPSSMSKIMAIYVLFENMKKGSYKWDDTFKVSQKAWKTEGSRTFVQVDTDVKIQDLARGVIVQSGNDAAVTLAEGCAGSEEAYAELMTLKAKELGTKASSFRNATGLPHEEHLMSIRDLALIAQKTIQNFPEFYKMYGETEFTYNNITQPNRNTLLRDFKGCDGLKTGFTEAGGYGLVASAVQDGRRLVVVVNGCEKAKDRIEDARKLLGWGYSYYSSPRLYKAGQSVGEADVWIGRKGKVSLVCNQDVYVTLPRMNVGDTKVTLRYKTPVEAPIKKGQKIAVLEVQAPNQPLRTIPLVAGEDVEKAGLFSRLGAIISYLMDGTTQGSDEVQKAL